MTDSVYLDLISRFGGPATTVTVACTSLPRLHLDMRTEGEGASETGWQFTQLVLHPSQLSILNTSKRFIHLAGPPGCGKTLVLLLKALDWIQSHKPALIVSTRGCSVAASHMLFHQLQQTAGLAASGQLQLHTLDVEKAGYDQRSVQHDVTTLLTLLPPGGHLLVIADEVSSGANALFTELYCQCPGLQLWTAGQYHGQSLAFMTKFPMTEPLRSPPSVTREVRQALHNKSRPVYDYTVAPSPLPCDGPAPRVVLHSGQGHDEKQDASDCYQCRMEVARVLQELRVGLPTSSSDHPLRYRDVFLLTWKERFDDSIPPSRGLRGMLDGLRDAGVPVRVVKHGDESAVADVATMLGGDQVVATSTNSMRGLERPVVVWVQTDRANTLDEEVGKLHAMSRCTAQLIWVKPLP